MKYYQTGQIGVGPRTDFHQIGTLDMEWLFCFPDKCNIQSPLWIYVCLF